MTSWPPSMAQAIRHLKRKLSNREHSPLPYHTTTASRLAFAVRKNLYPERDYLNTTFSIPVITRHHFQGIVTLALDENLDRLMRDLGRVFGIRLRSRSKLAVRWERENPTDLLVLTEWNLKPTLRLLGMRGGVDCLYLEV